MKPNDIRELTEEDIHHRLDDLKEELFNLRYKQATAHLENAKRIMTVRRDIARLRTIQRERMAPPVQGRTKSKETAK
jgi:large subunit ribosomal protein L29